MRQRPGDGKAIFITLEDETGTPTCGVGAHIREVSRRGDGPRLLLVEGRVQKVGEGVTHPMGAKASLDRTAEPGASIEIGAPEVELRLADEFAHSAVSART